LKLKLLAKYNADLAPQSFFCMQPKKKLHPQQVQRMWRQVVLKLRQKELTGTNHVCRYGGAKNIGFHRVALQQSS